MNNCIATNIVANLISNYGFGKRTPERNSVFVLFTFELLMGSCNHSVKTTLTPIKMGLLFVLGAKWTFEFLKLDFM